MTFEFDLVKSRTNKGKHGLDFDKAVLLWSDPNQVVFVGRFKDEERYGIIALLDDKLWCAIYTHRGKNIRIISVRRAREYEEDLYYNS